jgi:predicted nucleic acid-binding protein
MGSKGQYHVYWDSCVFLAYIKQEKGRADVIERLWEEIVNEKNGIIVTSTISIVEIAFGVDDAKGSILLTPEISQQIDDIWRDSSILLVETPAKVMYDARKLMRDAWQNQWSLKPYDAVHLATAMFVESSGRLISEFNTYDKPLEKYAPMTGILIKEPECDPKPKQQKLEL